MPSASASFLQVQVSAEAMRTKALALIRKSSKGHGRLEFLALALAGKKMSANGFGKVIKMIDDMAVLLKEEQGADDKKKQYCLAEFDSSDDKKKALERKLSQVNSATDETKEGIATLTDDIAALKAAIKQLDADVADATAQRKEENKAFTEMIASDSAAKELLGIPKNRAKALV